MGVEGAKTRQSAGGTGGAAVGVGRLGDLRDSTGDYPGALASPMLFSKRQPNHGACPIPKKLDRTSNV
jgi:hypothetical protein